MGETVAQVYERSAFSQEQESYRLIADGTVRKNSLRTTSGSGGQLA
jgi:hypothetical protein